MVGHDRHLGRYDPPVTQLSDSLCNAHQNSRGIGSCQKTPEASLVAAMDGEGVRAEFPGPRLVSTCPQPLLAFSAQEMHGPPFIVASTQVTGPIGTPA